MLAALCCTLLAGKLKCQQCSQLGCSKPAWEHPCRAAGNGYDGLSFISFVLVLTWTFFIVHRWHLKVQYVFQKKFQALFFPLIFFQEKKVHILFVCYGLLWDTTHNLTLFSPSMDNLFTGWRGNGMGWDGKERVAFMFSSNDFVYNYFLLDFLLTVYKISLYFNNSIVATAALIIFP